MASDVSVVAIVAAYNEADIIEHVVRDLIDQGIQVYFLDDGSTDGTAEIAGRFVGRGVLAVERRQDAGGGGRFEWERILLRKMELARELDADWFIHHDADEFRESPWSGLSLKEAIGRVDALGYNAVDFESLDFWPTHDQFRPGQDVRSAFPFYARRAPYDGLQIRCWKKTVLVDLASSGGHDALFPDRTVFPLRFILRHYPIRGQEHGERKIFRERRSRFVDAERARGWHIQYEGVREGDSFIRDCAALTRYDSDAVRLGLLLRHRGVESLEEAVRQSTADNEGLRRQVAALHESLQHVREEFARQAGELTRRDIQLTRATADLAELTRAAAEREQHLQAEASDLRSVIERQTSDIGSWRSAVDGLTARLDDIQRSLSWRWTSPARALLGLLRGR